MFPNARNFMAGEYRSGTGSYGSTITVRRWSPSRGRCAQMLYARLVKDDNRVVVIGTEPCRRTAAASVSGASRRRRAAPRSRVSARGVGSDAACARDDGGQAPACAQATRARFANRGWRRTGQRGSLAGRPVQPLELRGARFSREDFEDAASAGAAYAWPIGYDDLAPWYGRVEPLLHIAGPSVDAPQLPAGKCA